MKYRTSLKIEIASDQGLHFLPLIHKLLDIPISGPNYFRTALV